MISKDDLIRMRRKKEFAAFKAQREKEREEAEANAEKMKKLKYVNMMKSVPTMS